ncbi:MAG: hypothetical protein NUW02_00440 [Candidatus Campbellbacteria bacterium]|nr:hypothetical protein [Candidatus Campbellbacteria bacterium]
MNNEFSTIEDQLKRVSIQNLSNEEKQTLWVSIAREHLARPVVSPYSWMLIVHRRLMVTVSAILIFVLAGGSTVALADSAKPGDTLFALDRATEGVVLALTSEKSRDNVRVAMANERVDELEALISDESSRRLARGEQTPEATLMMATLAVDTATNTESGSGQESSEDARAFSKQDIQEGTSNSNKDVGAPVEMKDRKRSDIEEALSLVDEISTELEKRGNTEGHDSVKRAMRRLSGKFNELPQEDNDTFRAPFERAFVGEARWNDDDDSNDSDSDDDGDDSGWSNEDGLLSPPNPRFEDTLNGGGTTGDIHQGGGPAGGGSVEGTSTRDSNGDDDDDDGRGGNDDDEEGD